MKTAICFSGYMREYKKVFPEFYKTLLEPLKKVSSVDVFIHTWDKYSTAKSWAGATNNHKESKLLDNKIVKEDILKLYNTNFCEMENFEFKYKDLLTSNFTNKKFVPSKLGDGNIFWLTSMYYSIFKANELKREYENKHQFKYDFVIRNRPDIYLNKNIELKLFNDSTNYFKRESDKLICDTFWICNSKDSDIVCSLFKNLDIIFNSLQEVDPELFLNYWINKNNIEYNIIDYKFNFIRDEFGIRM